jgi:hypothetical protein
MNKQVKAPNEIQPPSSKEAPKEVGGSIEQVYMTEKQESFLIDGISAIAIHNGVARLKTFRFSAGPAGSVDSIELCIPVSAIKQVVEALNKVK